MINSQMSVWSFSDPLRVQMLLDRLTPHRRPWEKAEWDGCPSLSLQGARVSQNAGQHETRHAKGKREQEGV